MKHKAPFAVFAAFILASGILALPKPQKQTDSHVSLFNKLMKTRIGFHAWLHGSKLKHGTSFTFHHIAGDQEQKGFVTTKRHGICVQYAASGKIITIHDGKATALVLGSIPTKKSHIARLKSSVLPNKNHNNPVGIFSLNECWECDTSGLSALIKNDIQIDHYHYPTPDYQAPSFIDILRAVKDLENRDNLDQQVALVHCKAGRGRSATIAGAYVMHIIHQAQLTTTPDEIEAYLRSHRPQVHLGKTQKEALSHFWTQLQDAGEFKNLCTKHAQAIEERKKEVQQLRLK